MNRKGARHKETMEIQKYIRYGVHIDSVTYSKEISVLIPRYILGPANLENNVLKGMRVVANPRPVAMYLAPPKVKLLRMECV